MPLTSLSFSPKQITRGIEIIRQMKSITYIGLNPSVRMRPADFWKKYDAGEFK